MLVALVSACSLPPTSPQAQNPAPAIAANRYIADPISGKLGSPEMTLDLPDGALIAFSDETNRNAFRDNGARFQLGTEQRIGFLMYDPVARFPKGVHDPASGSLQIGSWAYPYSYGSATFLFANDENRQAFAQNPKNYIAGVGGHCLNAMRNRNTSMVIGDPHYTRFVSGMWYVFGGAVGPPRWDQVPNADKPREVEKAWAFYRGQTGIKSQELASAP